MVHYNGRSLQHPLGRTIRERVKRIENATVVHMGSVGILLYGIMPLLIKDT